MKTLLLARHAKSDWNQSGVSDFDRGLNSRGEVDAPAMASYLQQCGYLIHQIISSDAVRALATAEEYKNVLIPESEVIKQHDLYLASHFDIVQVANQLSPDYSTVMLVGHNPGMTEALNYFTKTEIEDMPTCSVAVVQFDIMNWKDITKYSGDLLAYEFPKKR